MPEPFDSVKVEFDKIIFKYKELISDGTLSFSDAFSLSMFGLGVAITVLQPYTEMPYVQRKIYASQLAQQFYDEVVAPLDLPIPNFIESFVDKQISNMIPALVEMAFDAIHGIINIESLLLKK